MKVCFAFVLLTACVLPLQRAALAADSVVTNGTAVSVTKTEPQSFYQTFQAPEVETVAYHPKSRFTYKPNGVSTYAGGTTIDGVAGNGYVMQISTSNPFGTGPVTLGDRTPLYASESASGLVHLTNKLYVSSTSYASSWDLKDCLVLHSIGFPANPSYGLRLGRAESKFETRATLALDDPNTDPMLNITLLGPIRLAIDGGVLKFRANTPSSFFIVDNQSATAEPSVTITERGTTFDVPANGQTSPGLPLTIENPDPIVTAVLETVEPANYRFESDLSGNWTVRAGLGPSSFRSGNGAAFDKSATDDYGTPDGTVYMMVRCQASISQTVNLPNAGLWRVKFLCGCRPQTDGVWYSPRPVTVTLGGQSHVFTFPEKQTFGFTELVTDGFELAAGDQTLTLQTGGDYADGSMNYDRIVLERVSYVYPKTPIGKTGDGKLTFSGQDFTRIVFDVAGGTLALSGGGVTQATVSVASEAALALNGVTADAVETTLATNAAMTLVGSTLSQSEILMATNATLTLDDSMLSESAVTVAKDAELTLIGGTLDRTPVTVAAGGRLLLRDTGADLVQNGSFETETDGWNPTTASKDKTWTLTVLEKTDVNAGAGGGFQCNGGAITPASTGPMTPYGNATAALRERTSLAQTLTVPVAGTYRLSFAYAPRVYPKGFKQPLRAKIDDSIVVDQPGATADFAFKTLTGTVELTAGEHVLSFESDTVPDSGMVSGCMLLIDNVQLVRVNARMAFQAGELRLSRGSVLDLDYDGRIWIEKATVDGVTVNGNKSALRAAGVTVVGKGRLSCGNSGFQILVR